jgi:hypothetical protein
MSRILLALTLFASVLFSTQTQSKPFVQTHWKDEPVEVVSVKLYGKTINPKDRVTKEELEALEITIKNVSESPISYVSALVTSPTSNRDQVMPATAFIFGSENGSKPCLQPNEQAVMRFVWSTGDWSLGQEAQLRLYHVYWNNDKNVIWSSGDIETLGPDGIYYLKRPEVARYR